MLSSTTNSNNSSISDKDDDNNSSMASSNSNSNARGTSSGNGKIISSSQSNTTTSDESGAPIPHQSDRNGETSTRAESSFAVQLMDMLRSEAIAGGRSVKWLPNGKAFMIQNQTKFEEKVLPRYFDSPCIFQSFLRRLYRWVIVTYIWFDNSHYACIF